MASESCTCSIFLCKAMVDCIFSFVICPLHRFTVLKAALKSGWVLFVPSIQLKKCWYKHDLLFFKFIREHFSFFFNIFCGSLICYVLCYRALQVRRIQILWLSSLSQFSVYSIWMISFRGDYLAHTSIYYDLLLYITLNYYMSLLH